MWHLFVFIKMTYIVLMKLNFLQMLSSNVQLCSKQINLKFAAKGLERSSCVSGMDKVQRY